MKPLRLFFVLMMIVSFTFTSCESNEPTVNDDSITESVLNVIAQDDAVIQAIRFGGNIQTLTDETKDGLLQMREEEKLAQDVYIYFYNLYKHRVFSNISKSEAQHTVAVLRLINYYGLTDPASTEIGVFNNEDIQNLYNSLISQGTTLETALATGAYIEEYDIKDLQDLIEVTTNANIVRVYTNLLNGSINHLKAFTRVLKVYGVTYTPTILNQEEYDELIGN